MMVDIVDLLANGWKGKVVAGSKDQFRITEWVGVVVMSCEYLGGLIGLCWSKLVVSEIGLFLTRSAC